MWPPWIFPYVLHSSTGAELMFRALMLVPSAHAALNSNLRNVSRPGWLTRCRPTSDRYVHTVINITCWALSNTQAARGSS